MSLDGTMNGMNVIAPTDALALQMLKELSDRSAAAAQSSQQAAQQHQQAAAQPAPDLAPLAALIPSLAGNFASVIGGNPEYGRRAQEDVTAQRKSLLQNRQQNLQALRDNASRLAEAAQQAGNLEAENKARLDIVKYDKMMDQITESQRHAGAMELRTATDKAAMEREAAGNASAERVARINAAARTAASGGGADGDPLQGLVRTTSTGKQFVDLTGLVGNAKNAATRAAGAQGLMALDAQGAAALGDVDRARRDVTTLSDYIGPLLPPDAAARVAQSPGIKLSKVLQTRPQRAAFKTYRDVAIPVLRAMAGSRGLRITQQQIQLSVDNLPTLNDSYETAQQKLGIINTILNNAEAPLVTRDWTTPGPGRGAKAAADTKDHTEIRVLDKAGKPHTIEAWELPKAVKLGYKRAPLGR